MDDLLKDAIADAKAVRETALENAKIALEEAFTPRLQSMLSKKIQSEIEVDEGEHEDDEDVEERMDDEDDMEERAKKMARDGDEIEDEGMHGDDEDEVEEGEHEEDEVEESDIIEIDGVKYAPVVSEEEDEDEMEEGEERGDDDDVDEDLDLDEILKELDEEEVNEEEEIEEVEEVDEDVDEIEENDVSSGVGKGDNAHDKKSGDSTDIGKAGKAKHESVEAISEEEDEDDEKKDESVEEDIDLEEIVKALSEEEDDEEEKNEVAELQSELDEHRNVVKYLRSKLNEVNLLNAKLLFTNKLFRSYGLNNDQKMKVVETFDRAHNLREVKLVYSTLAESFGSKQTKTEIKESKGSASKAVASTKSEKQEVIAEGHEMRDRFKKLAGIL